MGIRKVNPEFWKSKRVFLTGHTGFKGSWLSLWLSSMGALVKGYALEPDTNPSLFNVARISSLIDSEIGNIRNLEALSKSIKAFNPDILIHMAAQPLVRLSYAHPVETYSTNVLGTVHVLEAARKCANLKAIVSVTTDKVYENQEWVWGYRENEPMGGYDPYSSSKGCAELVTAAYRRSFFSSENSPALASARAGNVIGGGDWSLDRLIPDAIKAFENNEPVIIRNPLATRPWQHVLEPLSGYLILAESLYQGGKKFAEAWNFGPEDRDCKSVEWILDELVSIWGENSAWKLDQNPQPHEARFLKLDCSKAKSGLSWFPTWEIGEVLQKIVNWQLQFRSGADMQLYCLNEIKTYQE
ncbi:CDP-glucose 4,6-dehydratase [Algoriphagus sp. NBT04N3]|jgi:CDP-glucose 4,6-dehydratase|uniref:CDP-glucose 4,6-dehydratase n=1 Tax=Algoriphagus sp. NBT04N3 TaxID=2705473 RepID=UPI001C6290D0|nr:CDP-glucose 4,6-dehydratase [Algoriphagus sp. NBT04N3]QYH38980.1 CDP-glucose 4,6-dehydratase [Algoriphagus sp. NBT04N3]